MLIFSFTHKLTKHHSCMDTWTKTKGGDSLVISLVLTIAIMHTLLFFVLFLDLRFLNLILWRKWIYELWDSELHKLFSFTFTFHWIVYHLRYGPCLLWHDNHACWFPSKLLHGPGEQSPMLCCNCVKVSSYPLHYLGLQIITW